MIPLVIFSSTGDVVYNKTDSAGCHFSAICNQRCEIDRFQSTCPTSSPPASSAPLSPSSAAPPCDLLVPPRQVRFLPVLPFFAVCLGLGNQLGAEPCPAWGCGWPPLTPPRVVPEEGAKGCGWPRTQGPPWATRDLRLWQGHVAGLVAPSR